jgi:hypothetical protein
VLNKLTQKCQTLPSRHGDGFVGLNTLVERGPQLAQEVDQGRVIVAQLTDAIRESRGMPCDVVEESSAGLGLGHVVDETRLEIRRHDQNLVTPVVGIASCRFGEYDFESIHQHT